MRHLIVCTEYPPAPIPPGGIGTYAVHMARLLAEAGETVHVIGPLWEGAPKRTEEQCDGKLIIHRVSSTDPLSDLATRPRRASSAGELAGLIQSNYPPQGFAWEASLLADTLVEQAEIDVIETQDYSAPLYFFQLRRALGLGPKRRPPCILHFHSPTEFIVRYNQWDLGTPYFLTAKRLEDFSILHADTWLCPSLYLARQAEEHYGLERDSVEVIRLPIGDTPNLERDARTWSEGAIFYAGRLEPRKGVIEYVAAAVAVADEFPKVQFEFAGADLPYRSGISVRQWVTRQIPRHLRPRFHFRGSQPRENLIRLLRSARLAVVPSRWENFPNTCIEAMSSGLPVLSTRNGGMAEIIDDGRTGWIAAPADSAGLEAALRRALNTPPEELAVLGREASAAVRRLCDNRAILERHLDLRSRIARKGLNRSTRPVGNPRSAARPKRNASDRLNPEALQENGIAVVIERLAEGALMDECLSTVRRQTRAPVAVAVVADPPRYEGAVRALTNACAPGWRVCRVPNASPAEARNAGVDAVLGSGAKPLAFVFLDPADRLCERFIEICESVLHHCPEVGIVSSWVRFSRPKVRYLVNPCPALPYQLIVDDTVPATVFRTESLRAAGLFRSGLDGGLARWDLSNAILASGWTAITVPAFLGERMEGTTVAPLAPRILHSHMRWEILGGFSEIISRKGLDPALAQPLASYVVYLAARLQDRECWRTRPGGPGIRDFLLEMTLSEQLALVHHALRNPKLAIQFLLPHELETVRRVWVKLLKTFGFRPR